MIGALLRRNVGLKALSLALAVLTWAYLTYGANPHVRAGVTQQLEVPVALRNVAPGLTAQPAQSAVTVIVNADRGPFDEPTAHEFAAVIDLRGREAGTYSVVPRVVGPSDVDVERVRPASVVVDVERIVTRHLPVYVRYEGRPAQVSAVAGANVAPAMVTLRGAASAVARVAMIAAELPADRISPGFEALLAPVALDVHGRRVGGVIIAPNLVHVTVLKAAAAK